MKYIKSFENNFTDIFKKRKKLPLEVINFGEILTKKIEKAIDNDWDVYSNIYGINNKKYYDIISIFVDPHDLDEAAEVVELHYNFSRNAILYCYHPKMNFMENIQNFLSDIIRNSSCEDISVKNDNRYWIPLDKLPEIINKINDTNFELFKTSNKFNL